MPGSVAIVAALALLAGCALPSASPPTASNHVRPESQAPSAASTRAALADYQAMAKKLHSPRLIARMLLKEAKKKHSSGRAIMAALLALRAGDAKTAVGAADFLHALAPKQSSTWSVALRVALARGKLDEAGKAAAKAYALGGAKALVLGLDGPAEPWFVYPLVSRLAGAHPDDGALQLVLARSALAADAPAAAVAAARKAAKFEAGARAAKLVEIQAQWNLGRHKTALARAARLVAAHSHDIGLRVLYANMLAQAGEPRRARDTLGDARALAPNDAQVDFGYALIAADAENPAAARARLTAILEAGDDTSGVYNLLGHLAANENDWGEAFGWYQQIHSPDDLASSRIASLFALNHWKGSAAAQDYLHQLSDRFPGLAPTWAGVHASLLDLAGKSKAAWQLLGQTLKRYPRVRPLRYQRALLADKLGKGSDALAGLKRLTSAAPGNPLYLNAYGYTLIEHTKRYREAYGYIKRAFAIDSGNGAILDSMGWALYHLGQSTQALGYLRRAWRETGDITVAGHLVTVYLALNRRGAARKILRTALGQSPKDPKLLSLQRKLARR